MSVAKPRHVSVCSGSGTHSKPWTMSGPACIVQRRTGDPSSGAARCPFRRLDDGVVPSTAGSSHSPMYVCRAPRTSVDTHNPSDASIGTMRTAWTVPCVMAMWCVWPPAVTLPPLPGDTASAPGPTAHVSFVSSTSSVGAGWRPQVKREKKVMMGLVSAASSIAPAGAGGFLPFRAALAPSLAGKPAAAVTSCVASSALVRCVSCTTTGTERSSASADGCSGLAGAASPAESASRGRLLASSPVDVESIPAAAASGAAAEASALAPSLSAAEESVALETFSSTAES
mmetsp:Transcript_28889/g.89434  ORF Transcript_28889/g.89434 Transcript_28889/m.89434 type:complete len:286 (-) Transcript_28889:6-863(-)